MEKWKKKKDVWKRDVYMKKSFFCFLFLLVNNLEQVIPETVKIIYSNFMFLNKLIIDTFFYYFLNFSVFLNEFVLLLLLVCFLYGLNLAETGGTRVTYD